MFANDYQGGTHVEVLGTQGQNPLAQWKVTGPQKGVQKVYDKALKGYVFVSSGGCKLSLPKDERAALGLVQPHLLLQLEVGVGVPFSVEVGITDVSGTRRRIILSSSFSELKCTPLHCQVPFTALPRESWLNLVLPLGDLAAVLFRSGGMAAAGASAGSTARGGGDGGGSSYRTLDFLQLAGTCRLRRICTLRDAPQAAAEGSDGSSSPGPAGAKPLEFPSSVEHQILWLEPRSLTLVSLGGGAGGGGGGGGAGGAATGASGAAGGGGGFGVVGTSTGSSRRPGAAGGGGGGSGGAGPAPLPSVRVAGGGSGAARVLAGAAAAAVAAAAGSSGDEESTFGVRESGHLVGAAAHQGPLGELIVGRRGSSSGQSTPTARGGGGGLPSLPPPFGSAGAGSGPGGSGGGGGGHTHGHLAGGEHVPSRLGLVRTASGGNFNASGGPGSSQGHQEHQAQQQQAQSGGHHPLHNQQQQGPGGLGAAGGLPVKLPSIDGTSGGGGGGGLGGIRLPPVHVNGSGSAAAAAATAAVSAPVATSGGTSSDDSTRGDGSPFGGRRALSAQTAARNSGSGSGGTSPGANGPGGSGAAGGAGGGAAAGGGGPGGGGTGLPPSPPWPKSVIGKRAQSGPARISTEALSQGLGDTTVAPSDTPTSPSLAPRHGRRTPNATHIPPTISENEAMPGCSSNSGAGTPAVKSPSRSPSRTRPAAAGGAGAGLPAVRAGARGAMGEPLSPGGHGSVHGSVHGSGHGGGHGAAAGGGGGGGQQFAELSSLLTVRGGVDASIDLAAHPHLLDGSPGSSCILASNPKLLNGVPIQHTHRYGGGGSGAAAAAGAAGGGGAAGAAGGGQSGQVGASAGDVSSDSETEARPSVGAAAAVMDAVSVKVPRIRTRVPPGGATTGGGGGGVGGAAKGHPGPAAEGATRAAASPVAGPGPSGGAATGTPTARKAAGLASDVDTPTRVGRAALLAAGGSQNGRSSPVNTPVKAAGGGRVTPGPGAGAGTGAAAGGGGGPSAGSGPGPSSLGGGPGAAGRQRREDSCGTVVVRGSVAQATGVKPPGGNGPMSMCSGSPARQRPPPAGMPGVASARATPPRPAGGTVGGIGGRLPPLGGGRGRGAAASAAATAAAGGGRGGGAGRGSGRGSGRPMRPTTSNEVDVEESITLNAGLWGGFGVDEDDEVLGSRHFRQDGGGSLGNSGSDGEAGEFAGFGGGAAAAAVHRNSGSSSPDASRYTAAVGVVEDLPSPPTRYGNAAGGSGCNGGDETLSPPIRRVATGTGTGAPPQPYAMAWTTQREATFSGYNAGEAGTRAAYGDGDGSHAASTTAAAGGGGGGGSDALLPHDPLLDEEALLAGHVHHLDMYDDWAQVDQRPTPQELLHPHRAFTPPVVPASQALGIAISHGNGNGRNGGGRGGGRGGGGASGVRGSGPQVLKVSDGAGRGHGGGGGGSVVAPAGGEAMLDLMYDPVLNFYYDRATGQYYELRT